MSTRILTLLAVTFGLAATPIHAGSWRYFERLPVSEHVLIDDSSCDFRGSIHLRTGDTWFVFQCGIGSAPVTVDGQGNRVNVLPSSITGTGGEIITVGHNAAAGYVAINRANGDAIVENTAGQSWNLARFNDMIITGFGDIHAIGYNELGPNLVDPLVSRLPFRVLAFSPPELKALGKIVRPMASAQSSRFQAAVVKRNRLAVSKLGIYENNLSSGNRAYIVAGTDGVLQEEMLVGAINDRVVAAFSMRDGRRSSRWLYRGGRLTQLQDLEAITVDREIVYRNRRSDCLIEIDGELQKLWGARFCIEAKVNSAGRVNVVVKNGDRFESRSYRKQRASIPLVDDYLSDCRDTRPACARRTANQFARPTPLIELLQARGRTSAGYADDRLNNKALARFDWRATLRIVIRDGKPGALLARLGKRRASDVLLAIENTASNQRLSRGARLRKIRMIAEDRRWRRLVSSRDTERWGKIFLRY